MSFSYDIPVSPLTPIVADITTLFPKWFNIRRGAIFVSLIGSWALCPWIIIASAQTFLSFMSGYAIFMAPIAGILFSDFWIVKKRKYDVPALYDPRGIYRYNKFGTNWRALVTTLVVIVPLLPGLARAVSPSTVHINAGLQHLYSFNWLYGFCLSIFLYVGLNLIWPARATLIERTVYGTTMFDAAEADIETNASDDGTGRIVGIVAQEKGGEAVLNSPKEPIVRE